MVKVTVTVDRQHAAALADVAEALRATGMQVEQVLGDVGMVLGTIDADAEHSIRAVDGVQSVDRSLDFQVPPPDSPIQ
jgi:hypothetical protein